MARPELPGAAVPHSAACFSISVGGSHPLFQPPAKNALLFFVWLWYIGLGIVKAALKSSVFLFFLEQLCYFNLSPQGDGNRLLMSILSTNMKFQLIPARGRKHPQLPIPTTEMFRFQLIPARGRKPFDQRHDSDIITISTYPRKGTETFQSLRGDAFLRISTYPRKTLSGAARQLPLTLY